MNNRWEIYKNDIIEKGWGYFVASRMKKYFWSRKLWYLARKPEVRVGKYKLMVNKMDTVVTERLLSEGVWEPEVTKIFLRYAGKSKLIADVGANIGYYSLLGAKKSRVIAFEPESINFNLLKQTIEVNNITNIIAEKKAIGESQGVLRLYKNKENLGDHRSYNSGDHREYETVEVVTLDEYFGQSETIDLLKIDIQGFEVKAMKGAKKLLKNKQIKIIMSELWPQGITLSGEKWQDYISILKKAGFRLWEIEDKTGKFIQFDSNRIEKEFIKDPEFTTNIFAKLMG